MIYELLGNPDYDRLIELIKARRMSLFAGSGLSIAAGYPSMQELLSQLRNHANLPMKEIDPDCVNWPIEFQEIKNLLLEQNYLDQYRNGLVRIFNPDGTRKFSNMHLNILHIPFKSIVTTNYDSCFEIASGFVPKIFFPGRIPFHYPDLPISLLDQSNFFHIHGYIDYRSDQTITRTRGSIILSEDEYREAYHKNDEVTVFLSRLFKEYNVLFAGFGWGDKQIINVLENYQIARAQQEIASEEMNLRLFGKTEKFMLIADNEYKKIFIEKNLGALGIIPIKYQHDVKHKQLLKIIEDIRNKTSPSPIPDLPFVPEQYYARGFHE